MHLIVQYIFIETKKDEIHGCCMLCVGADVVADYFVPAWLKQMLHKNIYG